MIPTQKLSNILTETLGLISDVERTHHRVTVSFDCYRNEALVRKTERISGSQFAMHFPSVCKQVHATKVSLKVEGYDDSQFPAVTHTQTFMLAPKSQMLPDNSYGLGSTMAPEPTTRFMGGLGAVETMSLVKKMVSDQLLRKEHDDILKVNAELRDKLKKLEKELEEAEMSLASQSKIKETIELVLPFAPAVAAIVGKDTVLGQALDGIGAIAQQPEKEGAGLGAIPDRQSSMIESLVQQFLTELNDTHKSQLVSVMLRIRRDHSLITRIAQFVHTPPKPQAAQTPNNEQQSKKV